MVVRERGCGEEKKGEDKRKEEAIPVRPREPSTRYCRLLHKFRTA
jgi:hypothetical protein